jgi:AcrR family transcriptional regulator
MGTIYHHFSSLGAIFASLLIRRITSKQSIAINLIQSMDADTTIGEFCNALINIAFQDWNSGNSKVRNIAIRFYYHNAKEPELFFSYADVLIPYLDFFLHRNSSGDFRAVALDEWPLLLRAMQVALTNPFIEQMPIAGSDRHRELILCIWGRLLGSPDQAPVTIDE